MEYTFTLLYSFSANKLPFTEIMGNKAEICIVYFKYKQVYYSESIVYFASFFS